eukprot:COSAG05_NODE_2807_length_2617_cov_2.139396_2_plen_109_part_00
MDALINSWRACRSILDGYAVRAEDGAGDFAVVGRVVAGTDPQFALQPGQVAYITTGAKIPEGADAVVKVEDTEVLTREDGEETMVRRVVLCREAIYVTFRYGPSLVWL